MKGITHRYTYLWGVRIRRRLLFKERVPNFAWIQQGCLGWCDWKSACPPDIWFLCTGKVKG